MEIKPGYKQTEIGVIPEDWSIGKLSSSFPLQRGFDLPQSKAKEGCNPVVYSNGILNFHNEAMCKGPGVVTGRSGTLGKVFFIESDYWPHNTTLWVTNFKGNNPKYVFYLLSYLHTEKHGTGSGVPTLNRNDLHDLIVSLPPESEQKLITSVLTDIDSLITSLEKLIEKKKLIKQGVMQELLTGERRLPGFSVEWETKKLGTFCAHITTGRKDVNEGNPNGKYPFYTCSRAVTFSDHYSFDTEAILIAGNGDVGTLHYFTGKFEAYQRTYVLSGFNVNARYLVHYLNMNLVPTLCDSKIGTSIPYIKIGDLINMPVLVPMDDEELEYITSVLDDIESDIDLLELQLYKQVLLKQAMMQELLTGRIRLI